MKKTFSDNKLQDIPQEELSNMLKAHPYAANIRWELIKRRLEKGEISDSELATESLFMGDQQAFFSQVEKIKFDRDHRTDEVKETVDKKTEATTEPLPDSSAEEESQSESADNVAMVREEIQGESQPSEPDEEPKTSLVLRDDAPGEAAENKVEDALEESPGESESESEELYKDVHEEGEESQIEEPDDETESPAEEVAEDSISEGEKAEETEGKEEVGEQSIADAGEALEDVQEKSDAGEEREVQEEVVEAQTAVEADAVADETGSGEQGRDMNEFMVRPVADDFENTTGDEEPKSDFVKWLRAPKGGVKRPGGEKEESAGMKSSEESEEPENFSEKSSDENKEVEADITDQLKDAGKHGDTDLKPDIASETLADLLASQGHIEEANEMYRKLSLLYPEKSSYFASKIRKT
ncbi:MAG: hypothetical protein EA411_07575 [Saprospirales bacterium]|nr:MAG: hypothetical protein EA411_07575 [Saprospirales bacterium]